MAKRPGKRPAKSSPEPASADETVPRDAAQPDAPAPPSRSAAQASPGSPGAGDELVRRHLAFGWWSLAVFTALGLVLEAAHGLKLGWYLDVTSATRRLSFTLAHAHGTLLGLVNIAFALSLGRVKLSAVSLARAWFALRAVTVLLPLGFFLGGIAFYAGDPGFGIALVPPAGVLLVIALAMVARGFSSRR